MKPSNKHLSLFLRVITISAFVLLTVVGFISSVIPIRPFWIDEWFIIWNLKSKSALELMGPLDLLQQYPRVYLVIIKLFSSCFNYSYWSLRLPSFLVSICTMLLTHRVALKLFVKGTWAYYLFLLTIVSSFTFIEYMVQTKQYAMDVFISILILWQLNEIWSFATLGISQRRYAILCISLVIAPFFSYTYPILTLPMLLLLVISCIFSVAIKKQKLLLLLCAGLFGIKLFYAVDAHQLMTDTAMYHFWSFLLFNKAHKLSSLTSGYYSIFSQAGAGDLFSNLIGILGSCSFIVLAINCIRQPLRHIFKDKQHFFLLYACVLISVTIVLFISRRLPLGTPRLNAFLVPSVAILLISFINSITARYHKLKNIAVVILCIGFAGNVFTTCIHYFTNANYHRQLAIYHTIQQAINEAQNNNLPIMVTSSITFPYEENAATSGGATPEVWILKTFPAYNMQRQLPVVAKNDWHSLPSNIHSVLLLDGNHYQRITRSN